jgi:hypothetical protein
MMIGQISLVQGAPGKLPGYVFTKKTDQGHYSVCHSGMYIPLTLTCRMDEE